MSAEGDEVDKDRRTEDPATSRRMREGKRWGVESDVGANCAAWRVDALRHVGITKEAAQVSRTFANKTMATIAIVEESGEGAKILL
mmetsp:Transcript_15215/g.31098  ORF Transcript_15215/g.31098 Transcript_15215/m.31098 type:complete len:86 (-) Transcript_15215:123-380(-)